MIQIRQCRGEDFDQVVLLLRQLWLDKPLNPILLHPIFDRALVSDSKTYLCATDEKRVIGFGSLTMKDNLWPEGRLGYVDELVVDAKYRNRGIGKQLLERLIVVARQKGCCRIELEDGNKAPMIQPVGVAYTTTLNSESVVKIITNLIVMKNSLLY